MPLLSAKSCPRTAWTSLSTTSSEATSDRERGLGSDLYTIRDYVPSDSARHVHWKATAKTATLKTREFATEESRHIVLAFDRYGKPADEEQFESSGVASRLAGLPSHPKRRRSNADFGRLDVPHRSIRISRSESTLDEILNYLALVEMSPRRASGLRLPGRSLRAFVAATAGRTDMKRYCELSVHALVATAFFALAMTGRIDLLSIAVFTPVLAVSLYRALKALPPLLTPRASFYLSMRLRRRVLLDFSMYSRSLIGAAVHMVLFLELVKLHQEKIGQRLSVSHPPRISEDPGSVVAHCRHIVLGTLLLFFMALISTLMSFDIYRTEKKAQTGNP